MAVVDEIKGRLDILDLVSGYAQLQRSGRSYKAICPFHTERTPSFFVFPERQSWRCFGACAVGGDVFSFLMRIENVDFSEALKRLARQAGVNLAEKWGRRAAGDVLYSINEAAREFFSWTLASSEGGPKAAAYLQKRGLTQETINEFQLGLSPADGDSLRDHLTSKGYELERLGLAGVLSRRQEGGYRDMFWRRLMFPIRDADGRLGGFGARVLDDSQPKYINSHSSPIFDKSSILYGLHLAKSAILDRGIVIVEGYMDVIVAHQHGFDNVVASMGTSLTQQQVSLVRDLIRRPGASSSVVLALDPDAAGQEATLRSLESSWNLFEKRPLGITPGVALYQRVEIPSLKVAPLPQGMDPADVISRSPDEWAGLVESAVPVLDYLFTSLSSRLDLSTPQGKARLAELLYPLITATNDSFQQDYYFQRLAALLGVNEATLQASLGRPKPGGAPYRDRFRGLQPGGRQRQPGQAVRERQGASSTPFARLEHDPLEEYCLALILQNPRLLQSDRPLGAEEGSGDDFEEGVADESEKSSRGLRLEYFRRVENRELFTNWMDCSTLEILRESLDDEIEQHLDLLLAKVLPPSDIRQREADLTYCGRRLEERFLRELNREEEMRLSEATPEELEEQEQKIIRLNERLSHILKG